MERIMVAAGLDGSNSIIITGIWRMTNDRGGWRNSSW